MADAVEWRENISGEEWDFILSQMGGAPLQSALWGDSRRIHEGIKDGRWGLFRNNRPLFLVRFEIRIFFGIKIAWVPQGPVIANLENENFYQKIFLKRLKQKKFFICVLNP